MESNGPWVIRIENKAQSRRSPIANDTQGSDSKYTSGQLRAQGALKALVAIDKFAAPFVEQAIQYQVGTINLRTGAAELQQRVEFGLSLAKSAAGIGTGLLAGYAVGNVPGAIIGTLISGVTTVMNYANRAKTIRTEADLESITLRGLNNRAGGYPPTSIGSRSATQ